MTSFYLSQPSALTLLTLLAVTCLTLAQKQDGAVSGNNYGYFYNQEGDDMYRHNVQYISDFHNLWASANGDPICVPIPDNLTLCRDIGYDKMLLPNLLEQDSIGEVTRQAMSWIPLVRIECHPDTKVFLCSLFSPVCLERLIYPCRSLCQDVHNACIGRMKRYKFDWPEMLQCDRFPVDNDLCIKLMHPVIPDNNCTACKHPLNHESLIDHFCRTEIVMKVTVKNFKDDDFGNRLLLLRKKKKFYKHEGISKSEARRLTPVIEEGASCSCRTINATQERYLLMGKRQGDKLIIQFGMVWKKKDKEFRKGLRAIRKSSKCDGIFRELSGGEVDRGAKRNETVKGEGKRSGKKRRKDRKKKKGGKGRKGKKRRRKGRKGKKNRKDRKRKGKKDRKDKRGKSGRKHGAPDADKATGSKREAEKKALRNFRKMNN